MTIEIEQLKAMLKPYLTEHFSNSLDDALHDLMRERAFLLLIKNVNSQNSYDTDEIASFAGGRWYLQDEPSVGIPTAFNCKLAKSSIAYLDEAHKTDFLYGFYRRYFHPQRQAVQLQSNMLNKIFEQTFNTQCCIALWDNAKMHNSDYFNTLICKHAIERHRQIEFDLDVKKLIDSIDTFLLQE